MFKATSWLLVPCKWNQPKARKTRSKHINDKKLKILLFIMTEHSMHIFVVSPFFKATKQHLNNEKWDVRYLHLVELFCYVILVSSACKNVGMILLNNKNGYFMTKNAINLRLRRRRMKKRNWNPRQFCCCCWSWSRSPPRLAPGRAQ